MESLGLYPFDAAALAVVLVSAIMAFARGLIREVFTIFAFVGGALAAIYLHGFVSPFLSGVFPDQSILADLTAAFIVFVAVFAAITIATSFLARAIHQSTEIGTLDRILGAVYGILRGVLFLALVVLLMREITDRPTVASQPTSYEWLSKARLCEPLESIAIGIQAVIPEARQAIRDARSGEDVSVRDTVKQAGTTGVTAAKTSDDRICVRPTAEAGQTPEPTPAPTP